MKVLKLSTTLNNENDIKHLVEVINKHFDFIEQTNKIKFEGKNLFIDTFNKEQTIKDKLEFVKLFGQYSKLFKLEYEQYFTNDKENFSYSIYLPQYKRTIN